MPCDNGWVTGDIQLVSSDMELSRHGAPCSSLLQPAGLQCMVIGHRTGDSEVFCEHVNEQYVFANDWKFLDYMHQIGWSSSFSLQFFYI
jgi:hypothetical protein